MFILITLYMPKLKLEVFRKLYKSLKTPWKPINWLILGYLIGWEEQYINYKSKKAVDDAVEDYMVNHPPEVYKAVVKEHEDGSLSIGKAYEDLP
tara:strand:+ start:183 stop:464 length:282 start_codon:yes stop_codon:yes gene_type:complete